jgi:hypothetical protein
MGIVKRIARRHGMAETVRGDVKREKEAGRLETLEKGDVEVGCGEHPAAPRA